MLVPSLLFVPRLVPFLSVATMVRLLAPIPENSALFTPNAPEDAWVEVPVLVESANVDLVSRVLIALLELLSKK